MERVNLGKSGRRVSRIGLGCMGMSGMYGASDEAQAVATIRAVLPAAAVAGARYDAAQMSHLDSEK